MTPADWRRRAIAQNWAPMDAAPERRPWAVLELLDTRAPGWRAIGWDWAILVIVIALLTRLFEVAT